VKKITFLFPLYNEEKRISILSNFLKWIKKNKITRYEILLVSNGSTDKTKEKIYQYQKNYSFIKSFHVPFKSRGRAVKLAIKKSKYNLIAVCAIDNAWDLNFYKEAYKLLNITKYSVIFGPKTHYKSKVRRPRLRKIISLISSTFLKLMFGEVIDQDTQCVKVFKKGDIFFKKLLSDSNFFSDVEFFLFTKLFKLKYLSIPVNVKDNKGKVSLIMMFSFVLNAIKFKFSKNYKIGAKYYS